MDATKGPAKNVEIFHWTSSKLFKAPWSFNGGGYNQVYLFSEIFHLILILVTLADSMKLQNGRLSEVPKDKRQRLNSDYYILDADIRKTRFIICSNTNVYLNS